MAGHGNGSYGSFSHPVVSQQNRDGRRRNRMHGGGERHHRALRQEG